VDVKVRDSQQQFYQIEIQLCSYASLSSRILYNWADIYAQQLVSGDSYSSLQPTYSIWLLAEDLIKEDTQYMHHFMFRDKQGQALNNHGAICLLELNKFHAEKIEHDEQRWLNFFKEGKSLKQEALPNWMDTEEMRQAMSTLSLFSEKERQYDKYQARQEYLREQRALQDEFEKNYQALIEAKEAMTIAKQLEMEAKQDATQAQ